MKQSSVEYIEFHLFETFKDHTTTRTLLNVDWFESLDSIRAAAYMSRESPDSKEIDLWSEGKSIADLILLMPPISKEDLNDN